MIRANLHRFGAAAMSFVAAVLFSAPSTGAADATKAATPPTAPSKVTPLPKVELTVKVIHARRSGKFIDTRVRHIEKLLKPLFNFASYRLVKEDQHSLIRGTDHKVPLPFRVHVSVRQGGRVNNKIRLHLKVGRGNEMTLLLENGGTFLHGITLKNGQSYILAFTAKAP